MPIRVTCPGCGRSGNAPEGAAGKTVVCKGCGVAIVPSAPDMPTALVTGPPPPQPVQPMHPPPPVYAPLPGVQYFPPVATSVPQAPLAFESEPLVTVSGSYRRAAKRNVDVEEKPAGVDVCGLFAIGVAILS